MQNIEFPQAIVDVQHVTCFRFLYEDNSTAFCALEKSDGFLNDTVPVSKSIAVILSNEIFYCGKFAGIYDDMGAIIVKIRSVISPSCIVSIPFEQIIGWCLLPERV